ncbi:MAG: hypothetical protein IJP23_02800 [Oscillospiraceae bacterium]|nr:hypothetical protein [Oscillospiraceae bacterium]
MKKITAIILAAVMVIGVAGCSGSIIERNFYINCEKNKDVYNVDKIYDQVLLVNGAENGTLTFENTTFEKDLEFRGVEDSALIIDGTCLFGENAVVKISLNEKNIDVDDMPYVVARMPMDVVCTEMGAVVAEGDFTITFNGAEYSAQTCTLTMNEDDELVSVEEGVQYSSCVVAQWLENGEPKVVSYAK